MTKAKIHSQLVQEDIKSENLMIKKQKYVIKGTFFHHPCVPEKSSFFSKPKDQKTTKSTLKT